MIDRGEWLEARRKGIGGSDAAAILGLSRYRTAIDVYEDKLGLVPERPQTAAMQWGLRLEDAIATAYTEETGRAVRKVGGIRRAHHVRDFPMIASIDRLSVDGQRVVELKKKRTEDDLGSEDDPPEKRVPADWYVQTQHYLEVVDRDVADVAVLVAGSDFRVIPIPRDRDYGADLRTEEGAFWRTYVETGTYPPAGADDLANLGRRFGRSTDDERVATAEQAMLVETYLECVAGVTLAERQRDEVRAKLEESMGTIGRLLAPGGTITWRSHDVTRTSWKDYAGVLEAAIRRFRIQTPPREQAYLDMVLSDGWGTTDLDAVRGLYAQTKSERPFVAKRAKETE